ncbi:MAG: N-acetylmuramic acid 6-phosphate etherase [Phycisphaerae bacterium]|nr:N-acetylmuramic acid 6-phosphate etherase [Phycisphaerae bacterium]
MGDDVKHAPEMPDRGHLLTEQRHAASREIDAMAAEDAFDLMVQDYVGLPAAIAAAKAEIVAAIDVIVAGLRQAGRLIYVGAGTSGRLGVLDAAECPPTFLSDPSMVQGVIAGGEAAMSRSIEGAEDDAGAGEAAVDALALSEHDTVFGISAGGTTPFVHGALRAACRAGARTVFLACVPRPQAGDSAEISIRVLTGAEVLTGSTRLKAGIATKMVLNVVSTLAMVRLGKVFENLMVDVDAARCAKLGDRAVRIVMDAAEVPRLRAAELLASAGGRAKVAIVMARGGVPREAAEALLARSGGAVRAALAALGTG